MKRIILTSVCTLVLSLTGAFGSNTNSMNLDNDLNTNNKTTEVVKSITNNNNQTSLYSDNQKKVANNTTQATNQMVNKVAPQKTGVEAATYNCSNSSLNSIKACSYRNVDLSQCKSVNDVVKALQKCGYRNITKKNICRNKSLKQILAYIKANNTSCGNTISKPVTKPATTVMPTPVTKSLNTITTNKPAATAAPSVKPVAPASNTGINNYASEVLRLINVERAKAGLSALTTNATITAAANKRAQETAQSFSHTRPNGSGFSTVLNEYGVTFRAAGENIAYGQRTPQEVVTAWMNSPGHRANILNANFNKLGIGVYQKNGVIYWTQEFTD